MPRTAQTEGLISVASRRQFLASAAQGAALVALISPNTALAEGAQPTALERTPQFQDAFSKLVGTATPVDGKIKFELPEVAENGNFVPVTITVDSPMTADDHVKAIHILSTSNPVAKVATFRLSPLNGVARVQSRMRLAKTQDVITLAELSNGSLAITTLLVKVTIGGCQG